MKTRTLKRTLIAVACAATLLVGSASMCFADSKSVPAHINVGATSIDFSVTEKINMTGAADSTDLTVDSLSVTNHASAGVLDIDSIAATAVSGWTIVGMDTDFTKLAAGANKLALQADNSHDMASAYTGAGTVDPGATDTTTFTGKTGMVTEDLSDVKVADIVVTVSFVSIN